MNNINSERRAQGPDLRKHASIVDMLPDLRFFPYPPDADIHVPVSSLSPRPHGAPR